MREGGADLDPILTEGEFIVDQLGAYGLVDLAAISAIKRQFKHLTRRGHFALPEDRRLTPKLVYEELRERVTKEQPVSDGAHAHDITEEGDWRWGSFEEWREGSWRGRVVAEAERALLAAAKQERGRSRSSGNPVRNVVGAMRRGR